MRLIAVRHGETEENASGILQGHLPGELTDKGKEQVKKLAERLKDETIDHIFASDLARTRDTARAIAQFHEAPLEFRKELRERHMGQLTGQHHTLIEKEREEKKVARHEYRPAGGESYRDMRQRLSQFLEELKENYPDKNILLVTHGGVNRVLISLLTDKSLEEAAQVSQDNTAVNIFEMTEGSTKTITINDTRHL